MTTDDSPFLLFCATFKLFIKETLPVPESIYQISSLTALWYSLSSNLKLCFIFIAIIVFHSKLPIHFLKLFLQYSSSITEPNHDWSDFAKHCRRQIRWQTVGCVLVISKNIYNQLPKYINAIKWNQRICLWSHWCVGADNKKKSLNNCSIK